MTCKNKNDIKNELSGEVCYNVSVTVTGTFTVKAKNHDDVEEIILQAVEDAVDRGELEVTSSNFGYDDIHIGEEVDTSDYVDLEVDEDYYDN